MKYTGFNDPKITLIFSCDLINWFFIWLFVSLHLCFSKIYIKWKKLRTGIP
jgi:hypothetical protein